MKHFIYLLFLLITVSATASAKSDFHNIDVSIVPVSGNPFENEPYVYRMQFTNHTSQTLLPNNWVIYFNKAGTNSAPSFVNNYKIERVNGVLYQIKASADFASIASGESFDIYLQSSGPIMNVSDVPNGIFIHYLNENKFYNLPNPKVLQLPVGNMMFRSVRDQMPVETPEIIYKNNMRIETLDASALPLLLPTPSSNIVRGQGVHRLNATYAIENKTEFHNEIAFLRTNLKGLLQPTRSKAQGRIVFEQKNMGHDAAYEIHIDSHEIRIIAGSAVGCFYAVQSLLQLIPVANDEQTRPSISIPALSFSDAPRFDYRAIHLDVSRNFQPKEQILKLLDAMAMYKLNVFHLHFSDDDGWRIEMPSLPELTEVGAKRGMTDPQNMLIPVYGSGALPNNVQGSGFYTRADFIEILRYATARHIEVIPEIETPGHARAAIVSMEARYRKYAAQNQMELANQYRLVHPQDASVYRTVQYWNDNIMDVSLPSTYAFIERVVDDLRQMYVEAAAPLRTIHMGGDEVPAGVWEKSPAFEIVKQTNKNVRTTDDLWFYFFSKVNTLLKNRDLFLSGWEEAGVRFTKLDGRKKMVPNPMFANENFHLDVWNNVPGAGHEDLAYTLANAGYKVVLSCVTHNYFDMAVYKSFHEPGYYWGSFVDTEQPFAFIPFDYFKNFKQDLNGRDIDLSMRANKTRLTDYGKSNIVGIKGLLWTETVTSELLFQYKMYPKLLALAERAWAPSPTWAEIWDEKAYNVAFNNFVNQLGQRECKRLDRLNGGYLYRIPQPGLMVDQAGFIHANMQFPGFVLRYSTDGTVPTNRSKIYSQPIQGKGIFTFSAFSTNGNNQSNVSILRVE